MLCRHLHFLDAFLHDCTCVMLKTIKTSALIQSDLSSLSLSLSLSSTPGEDPSGVTDAAVHTLYREANKFALVSL